MASAVSFAIWWVPAARCPPPSCGSINLPTFALLPQSTIDLPMASTAFWCCTLHTTWVAMLAGGNSA